MVRTIEAVLAAAMILLWTCASAHAGGGPENLVLVVNSNSNSSKLIANYYIQLRNIPDRNIIHLSDVPEGEKTSFVDFRNRILVPIYDQIRKRGLANHVDYIVYSSDFPTSIRIDEAVKSVGLADGNSQLMRPTASINSMTYFMHQVLVNKNSFVSLFANSYMRQSTSILLARPFQGETQTQFNEAVRAMRLGELEKSTALFIELHKSFPAQVAVSYWLARVFAEREDPEQAAVWLQRAVDSHWSYRAYSQSDPAFKKIKEDANFKKIVNSIPDYSYRFLPTLGFRGSYGWGVNGMPNRPGSQGESYVLSTVLAVTRYRGLSERAALDQIIASVKADGTHPDGRFYFCRTNDIRTKTRVGNFDGAIAELNKLGYESELVDGPIPIEKRDIVGLTMGAASFNFSKSNSRILPGAICENLTSYGGRLDVSGQTPLTEFLRFGAAGSSGTVIEPYAIQEKFPDPRIHVHYVRGCSLAESFYQSVHGPFQLLIVGDALCQPWADFPTVAIRGLKPGQVIGKFHEVELDFDGSPVEVAKIEFYVDGRLVQRLTKRNKLRLETADMSDGVHELRIVAIAKGVIESRGRAVIPFVVSNNGNWVRLDGSQDSIDWGEEVELTAESNCGETIELVQNSKVVATGSGPKTVFRVPAKLLGRGPVRLTARVELDDDSRVASSPFEIEITGKISMTRSVVGSKKPSVRKNKKNVPRAKKK